MWQHDFMMKKIFSVQYFYPKTQADWLPSSRSIPDTQGSIVLRGRWGCNKNLFELKIEPLEAN
jgi:hypothetical protein